MSNVLGTMNDIGPLAGAAHAAGALVLVDASQAAPHLPVDVQDWDADFVGDHRRTRCSVRRGSARCGRRRELLEAMPPFLGGGEMIRDVRKDGFTTNDVPWKFEAGTPAIAEAIGFGAAIDYLEGLGMDDVRRHEVELTQYALDALEDRFGDASRSTARVTSPCGAASSPSCSRASTRTTSRRSSTRMPCASAPVTTAPSR